jgi:hypothetical protein
LNAKLKARLEKLETEVASHRKKISMLEKFKQLLLEYPSIENKLAAQELGVSRSYISKLRSQLGIQDTSMARNFGFAKGDKEIHEVSNADSVRLSKKMGAFASIYRVSASNYRISISGNDPCLRKIMSLVIHGGHVNVQRAQYIFIMSGDTWRPGMTLTKVLERVKSFRFQMAADFPFESMYCPVTFRKEPNATIFVDYMSRIDPLTLQVQRVSENV